MAGIKFLSLSVKSYKKDPKLPEYLKYNSEFASFETINIMFVFKTMSQLQHMVHYKSTHHEYVVPKSIPITVPTSFLSSSCPKTAQAPRMSATTVTSNFIFLSTTIYTRFSKYSTHTPGYRGNLSFSIIPQFASRLCRKHGIHFFSKSCCP